MLKPRLIFTLLYADKSFNLSRNFKLQKVGDYEWLINNYDFESIARSIDELAILNVNKDDDDFENFCMHLKKISEFCFMPIAVGGNIRNTEQTSLLFDSGADKVVLNTTFFTDHTLIKTLVKKYGSQSIVSSIDFKKNKEAEYKVYINNGLTETDFTLSEAISQVEQLGAGEVYLTSIENDGTGFGYDLEALRIAHNSCNLPIIASGGADTYDKLVEGLNSGLVSAVSTSHLYNFICDGLKDARESMIEEGIQLSNWNFEHLKLKNPNSTF